mmetsp:Transcript_7187/g.23592  ORF Transcript_7187/g.23592 Transcript_7187/m.23592 type:complete len:447 (+) Transcript_7187:217-1557(+)
MPSEYVSDDSDRSDERYSSDGDAEEAFDQRRESCRCFPATTARNRRRTWGDSPRTFDEDLDDSSELASALAPSASEVMNLTPSRSFPASMISPQSSSSSLGRKTHRKHRLTAALNELPVDVAKRRLLEALEKSNGEPRCAEVVAAAAKLSREARAASTYEDDATTRRATGKWRALTRAHFPGSVSLTTPPPRDVADDQDRDRDHDHERKEKKTKKDFYAYSLGRMSFGLFAPRDAIVRVDDCYNLVRPLDLFERPRIVPDSIKSKDIRRYNIKVRFTVEDPRAKGLRGTITTYGYCAPAPKAADDANHRLDVWFVAGDLAPDDMCQDDQQRWADLFGKQAAEDHSQRSIVTRATLWFVSVALGIKIEPVQRAGYQSYVVQRPMTGHVDVLYSDDDLRVTRGNRNSLVVLKRVRKDLDFNTDPGKIMANTPNNNKAFYRSFADDDDS